MTTWNEAEHRHHIQLMLAKLRDHHLYLKAEKYLFYQSSTQFLSYIISAEGIQMDEEKVEAVKFWPVLAIIKELQCFLGFANFYRRFIKIYSQVTAPLTSLLKNKPKSLSWSPEAIHTFNALKEAFTSSSRP